VSRGDFSGRNIHFGVREHGMAAIANGLALHEWRPFVATFFTFSDYLRPSLRLAALGGLPVIYVFTHDSIALGEDGPTHQPVEQLAALRAIPGLEVIRPADGTETAGAWLRALSRRGPTALVLSRQNLPELQASRVDGVGQGAYQVAGSSEPEVVLLATGSEVSLAIDASELLAERGVAASVVSMPCWEAAEESDLGAVLPAGVPVLSVEAAVAFGWRRWADAHVSLERFGAAGKGPEVYRHLGFTPEAVADAATRLLAL
jgi:transketolase